MTITIVTRSGKGSPVTNAELDANFNNIKTALEGITSGTGILNVGNGKLVTGVNGNVGVGVTPSAWFIDASQALQINKLGVGQMIGIDVSHFTTGAYRNSSDQWIAHYTGNLTQYLQYSGKLS